jgi:protein-tyrosine phosphatase
MKEIKVLMVCLGNKNIVVDSCGTGGWHIEDMPDKRSIDTALKFGIDISDQRARKLRSIDFEDFDWIFAMDIHNYNDLKTLAKEEEYHKIHLILDSLATKGQSVPDPYYGGVDGFTKVYHLLNEAIDAWMEKLV